MAVFGSFPTVRVQAPQSDRFAAAFAYLEEVFRAGSAASQRLKAIEVGATQRVELPAGAFALEQAYVSKARSEGFFESHRKFVDVQVIVAGAEWIEVADRERCVVRRAYQEDRDLIVYEDVPAAARLCLRAGDAAIFFPVDVHMPGLHGDSGGAVVRKTVIKVPADGA